MKKEFIDSNKLSLNFLDNLDIMIYLSDIETGEIIFLNKKIKEEFSMDDSYIGKLSFLISEGTHSKDFNHYDEESNNGDFIDSTWEEYNFKTNKYYKITDSFVKLFNNETVHLRQMVDITDEIVLKHKIEDNEDYIDDLLKFKSSFYKRISNKIHNPINKLKGLTNIALTNNNDDYIKKNLDKIYNEIETLDGYMKNIFYMSLIDANKLKINEEAFSLEDMFIDISKKANIMCMEKNQTFGIKMDSSFPPYFYGDVEKIKVVILSLLENGIKFTPSNGKIQINVTMEKLHNNTCYIEISINDTGFGMDVEQEKNIIKLFEEENQRKITNYDGVGLGLSLCQSIANKLGGKLDLYSSTRIGTTVSFKLNLKIFDNVFYKKEDVNGLNIQKLNVLILDSSFEVCENLRKIMVDLKINCETTTTYIGFIDKIENAIKDNRQYNIIFIEDNIKNMNSLSVTRMIKEKFINTDIVLLENPNTLIDKRLFKGMGVSRFIEKPIFPIQITNIIEDIVHIPTSEEELIKNKKLNFYDKHILLVDKIKLNQEIIKKILKDTKVKITGVDNFKVALEMIKENYNSYDLIFIDISLDEKNTMKLGEFIKDFCIGKKNIPIIAITDTTKKKDVDKLIDTGFTDYIKKPITNLSVIDIVVEYLKDDYCDNHNTINIHEYIKIEEGLLRVNDNEKVYKVLLNNFINKDSLLRLKYELANKKYEKAYKISHDIKCVSASLSLIQLYEIASRLERYIFDKKDTEQLMKDVTLIYEKTLDAIDSYLF